MFENKTEQQKTKAVLICADTGEFDAKASIDELEELAETAEAETVLKVIQKREVIDNATVIGSGRLEEVRREAEMLGAEIAIFDCEMTASQMRETEDILNIRVIDRTTLILDIFAMRAKSKEGKLQVELAQQKYRLPRLAGIGTELSRLGGGIGTRGPGETKLETDRRHIRTRIQTLERNLKELERQRQFGRIRRKKDGVLCVAIVGYTNAGKSTLLNRLTGSEVFAENKLFATLDTTSRGLELPDGRNVIFIDTVGFISRLPHNLVEAFKSTLEEVAEADVILHVVDGSHPDPFSQVDAVNDVLADIEGTASIPRILVFNKADQADEATRERLAALQPDAFIVSAYTGEGLDELRTAVESLLPVPHVHVNALLPYTAGSLISRVREYGKVDKVEYRDDGIQLEADVDAHLAAQVVEQSID